MEQKLDKPDEKSAAASTASAAGAAAGAVVSAGAKPDRSKVIAPILLRLAAQREEIKKSALSVSLSHVLFLRR
jgi:hypothetical protein